MIQRSMRRGAVSVLLFGVPFSVPAGAQAQEAADTAHGRATASEYHRAEQFLGWNARTLVSGDTVDPVWLEDDRFWYRNRRIPPARTRSIRRRTTAWPTGWKASSC